MVGFIGMNWGLGSGALVPQSGEHRHDLEIHVGETCDKTILTDDYRGKTLKLVFEELGTREDVAVVSGANITPGEDAVTFTVPADVSATPRKLRWSLRDSGDGDRVLKFGFVLVRKSALQDS